MTPTDPAAALVDQFTRSWDMVIAAASAFPPDRWQTAASPRTQPVRLIYHLLRAAERYNWLDSPDCFDTNKHYTLDWINAPLDQLPDQPTAIKLLHEAKAASLHWVRHVTDADQLNHPPMWAWTGPSTLSQAIYHIRHLQHHMAELNLELRHASLKPIPWQ